MAPPRLTLVSSDRPEDGERRAGGKRRRENGVPVEALATLEAQRAEQTAVVENLETKRIVEALLFAAAGPLDVATIARSVPAGTDVQAVLTRLQADYEGRGVVLVRVAGKWAFRTAEDLAWLLERQVADERKLSRAALEMLAIIAYHQPVTRAEMEEIRGVATSKGTLDVLLETGWVRPRGRRRAPGRPVTYGTTEAFLAHFGLDAIKDLPGLAELRGAGLLDGNLPPGFTVPDPTDVEALMPDELPLDPADGEDDEDSAAGDLFADDPGDEPDDGDGDGEDAPDGGSTSLQ